MAHLINEVEIRETWAPIIESATGINDANKLAWMSEYCHNHKLYEEATLSSVQPVMLKGMGVASLPNMSLSFAAQNGSGDKAPSLLPLAMQVAAQTVGLDLVPVVPMAGPMGLLSYLDFVYDGGAARTADAEKNVYFFSTPDGTGADIAASATFYAAYTYLGESRIDGHDIYKVVGDALVAANLQADFRLAVATPLATVSLVKALEDHIPAFAGANAAGDPFSREAGERTPENIMGLSLFSKSVAAETFQVAAAVTREQVQDLKQFGVDAVAQVEAVLTNELTQSINNLILRKIAVLGAANITKVFGANGFDLALPTAATLAGGETVPSVHRRILSQVLASANLIANRGRRGAGNFAVVGPQVATVLQSVAGFVANPMANTFSQAAGAIYPVGSVAGINVYTDPRKEWNDFTVVVGRKGDGNSPGLVFMPYLMAESVQTIAEGTMAPKIAVKSRFALVEAGFHPETQYVEFEITGSWTNLLNLA